MNRPSWVRWRILILLIFASFVDYSLRFNLSLAASSMMSDLGLSEIQWGWVMAAFPLGYAIFQLPGGVAADRYGPRKVLALSMLAWAVLIVLTALVPGADLVPVAVVIGVLLVVQFLVGATHAPIYPTLACTVQRWFPVGSWALPTGLSSTGLTWGVAAVTPVLVALIAAVGWRMGFMIIAPMGLISAALWWWQVRDYPSLHPAVNEHEQSLIDKDRGDEGISGSEGDWRLVVRNRDLLLLTLAYSCMNYGFWTAFGWLFYYLESIAEPGSTLYIRTTSLQWIAGGFAAAMGGWFCDYLCRRIGFRWGCRAPIVIAMLASGSFLGLGLLLENPVMVAACIITFFFFNQFSEGPFWNASMAIGRELAGAAGGVMNTGANAMGVISLFLAPVIASQLGWKAAIGTLVPFTFLAAVLMLFVRADRPVGVDAQD